MIIWRILKTSICEVLCAEVVDSDGFRRNGYVTEDYIVNPDVSTKPIDSVNYAWLLLPGSAKNTMRVNKCLLNEARVSLPSQGFEITPGFKEFSANAFTVKNFAEMKTLLRNRYPVSALYSMINNKMDSNSIEKFYDFVTKERKSLETLSFTQLSFYCDQLFIQLKEYMQICGSMPEKSAWSGSVVTAYIYQKTFDKLFPEIGDYTFMPGNKILIWNSTSEEFEEEILTNESAEKVNALPNNEKMAFALPLLLPKECPIDLTIEGFNLLKNFAKAFVIPGSGEDFIQAETKACGMKVIDEIPTEATTPKEGV